MRPDFIEVAPEDTLGEVAERMTAKNVGAVVVKDFGKLIGILTERDLLKAMAARVHTSEARVRQWMTGDPITAVGGDGRGRGGERDARARVPPPAGAGRRRSGDRRRQPAARRRRHEVSSRLGSASADPTLRSLKRPLRGRAAVFQPYSLPARANSTNASATRVDTLPAPRTREISRVASIPSRRASARVPAARSDSTAVREMNVTP